MAKKGNTLYIGTGRFVAALDAQTGEERWRTKLGNNAAVVTLLLKDQQLFAGHYGRVYCLDAKTGAILWKNDLPKMGYNAVLCAMEGAQGCSSPGAAVASQKLDDDAAVSAGAAAGAAAT